MKKVIEVERLKEAFGDMREGYPKATDDMVSVKDIFKIIDELAKENKSEQTDTEFNHEAFYEFLLNLIPNETEKYRNMFFQAEK